jgi:hypothetical protein
MLKLMVHKVTARLQKVNGINRINYCNYIFSAVLLEGRLVCAVDMSASAQFLTTD